MNGNNPDDAEKSLLSNLDESNQEGSQKKEESPHGYNDVAKCPLSRKISLVSIGSMPKTKSTADVISNSNKSLTQTRSSSVLRKSSVVSNIDLVGGSAIHIALDDPVVGENKNRNTNHKNKSTISDCFASFFKIMGFDLLGDLVYLNIVFGLALVFVGDLHFRMIMPFYMLDMQFTKQEVATVLSSMAIADVLSRVIMPLFLDRLSITRRTTLLVCCVLVAVSRSALAFQEEAIAFTVVAILNGFIRGMTLINVPLVLSEYANKDNFPSVLGLSMVARGIFIVILGPLGGYIRDYTESYPVCIHAQSLMFILCAISWILEYIFRRKPISA